MADQLNRPGTVEQEMPTQPIPRAKGAPTQLPTRAAVEEEMPTQPIPRVRMPRQLLSAAEMADPGAANSAAVEEEMPTQPIPRVRMPRQQLSTTEMADPGAADPRDVDAQKVDGEKELAEDELDGAKDYRTRVEEAELPNDVRKRRCARSASLNEPVTRAPSPARSGSGSKRFSTCRGAPRPRTG